ncbi:unnamed protein product [Calypogeia fissa]
MPSTLIQPLTSHPSAADVDVEVFVGGVSIGVVLAMARKVKQQKRICKVLKRREVDPSEPGRDIDHGLARIKACGAAEARTEFDPIEASEGGKSLSSSRGCNALKIERTLDLFATFSTVPMEIVHRGMTSNLLNILLIICIACISTVKSQDGFLSIDCGNNTSYVNNATGIFWVPNAGYISTGRNIDSINILSFDPIPNRGQVNSLRYFDDPACRDCYVLPVEVNETYLVRATWFYGNLTNGSTISWFQVAMDNNYVMSWSFSAGINLDESYSIEIIYSAPRSNLNFCLVRVQGPSFISALELIKLATGMYAAAVGPTQYSYLFTYERM